ncbi:MAG: hypothetical protein ACFFEE_05375 [Candidatus Thorarchaeota archaeon]
MKQKLGIIVTTLLILSIVAFAFPNLVNYTNTCKDIENSTEKFSIASDYPDLTEIPANTPLQLIQDFEMIHPTSLQFDVGIIWYGYEEERTLDIVDSDHSISEVFLFNGTSVIQLTDNNYTEKHFAIQNGKVTWSGFDGHDYEIFVYNGQSVIQVTDNEGDDQLPQIYNLRLTWTGRPNASEPYHIYLKIPQDPTHTFDLGVGTNSHVHGGGVVWESDGEIFLYNGTETIQLTTNTLEDRNPRIYNNLVCWEGNDGNDLEIFLYNETVQNVTRNSFIDTNPMIDDLLVWYSYDGEDDEVCLYGSDKTKKITNNRYNDSWIRTDNRIIAWQVDDGDAFDIMCYDHTLQYPVFRITDNETHNNYCPDVYNRIITWVRSNSIYVFRLNTSQFSTLLEPGWDLMHVGTMSVAIVGIVALVILTWIRED